MIFEQEYIFFELLDVFYSEQSLVKKTITDRNFDTIAFRYNSDTIIDTPKQQAGLDDGSICYFPSNAPYTRISKSDKMIVIHFKAYNYHSKNAEYFSPNKPQKYRELFKQILNMWNNKDISYKYDSASILHKIFSELYKDNMPVYKNDKITKSVLYIQKNYLQQNFSVSEAASKSFMSEQYFRKLFKKEFGISPKRYVIENRIKRAQALILTNNYSIAKISELCGYSDYSHFSKEFKRITDVSPSQYFHYYNNYSTEQSPN